MAAEIPRTVLVDTDPGVDDSMAILFGFASAEVEIVALTTVFGNGGTEVTATNALRLVELAGRPEVPVARGAETPLLRPYIGEGWRVHGRNGMGEAELPPPAGRPDHRRATQLIVEAVLDRPGELTLLALGPLTNLALAVRLEPEIAGQVREVVLMGGSADGVGNASPAAEANIRNDPEAAHVVFNAGWPVTMVGLNLTRQVVMTPRYLEALRRAGNPFTDLIGAITPHYLNYYRSSLGLEGMHVHDPSAMAYLIEPRLFETREVYLDVELASPHAFGQTIPDWRGQRGQPPNVRVAMGVEAAALLELYRERLAAATPAGARP